VSLHWRIAQRLEEVYIYTHSQKGDSRECQNNRTIALISLTSKVMLKIIQNRMEERANAEIPEVQAGFRKGRGTVTK